MSSTSSAGTPSSAGPVPPENRSAMYDVSAGLCTKRAAESGPAMKRLLPSQIRSMHPSGRMRARSGAGPTMRPHSTAPGAELGRSQ